MALALCARALLLATNTVSFHSDEAIVALMARHILQGERPVFFYGQAYLGSLDSWLVAVGFALFSESVSTIRLVQSALYMLVVASSFAVAWHLTRNAIVAVVVGLVLAVPPVMAATYTTATLGGYNETLLLGNILLLLSYAVTHGHSRSVWRWGLLGFCAGIAWWANGLIIAYALPIGVLILKSMFGDALSPNNRRLPPSPSGKGIYSLLPEGEGTGMRAEQTLALSPQHLLTFQRPILVGILIAIIGFVVGSAPWWVFALENDFAPLQFYLGSNGESSFASTDMISLPFGERLIGLFFLGLPTLVGMRFPWSSAYFLPLVGVVVLAIYAASVFRLMRGPKTQDQDSILQPDARLLVLSMIGLFCLLFVGTRFSNDPTGRYFLPLVLPLAIALGALVASVRRVAVRLVLVGIVLAYFAAGQISAATNPPGFTTQFNLINHIPNDHDDELIAFLDEHGLYNGYTSYWISFRLAFLSGERMQYSATLPEKPDLSYTPFYERYPPYRAASDAAERVAYITANVAEVETALEAMFAVAGVTYQWAQVGPYRIYYDFSPQARTPRPPFTFR